MDIETLRDYCLRKKGATEDFPFGETTLVFKVGGKIFLFVSLDASPLSFSAKLNPDRAVELREQYDSIKPGWHLNKTHWSSVRVDGTVPARLMKELIDESYGLVAASLPKKDREKILGKKQS